MSTQSPSSSVKPQRSRSRKESFLYAFSGLWYTFQSQPNFRIHIFATLLVFGCSIWLQLSRNDWIFLLICIAFVWVTELINTSIEAAVDLASPHIHPLAKTSKDVAAGAVLISVLFSILVGGLILGPALWRKVFTS